ncbi:MAG: response regulator [Chloroflexi bacterium]|nr:response regulator [Chloroflexota bacterium]MDA1219532.1 response regulator [Chloroflexota bacterium]
MPPTAVKGRVLIIEDDLTTRMMIGRILNKRGYEVMGAGNGITGYEKAAAENPDLILLDVMMPELDGTSAVSMVD